ncbi:unnamed protein product [Amoebophrya sp. A25]|nr:unnamed protein product [Amoebophrya sp. A25]|eukprot:GSA25T00008782001.1
MPAAKEQHPSTALLLQADDSAVVLDGKVPKYKVSGEQRKKLRDNSLYGNDVLNWETAGREFGYCSPFSRIKGEKRSEKYSNPLTAPYNHAVDKKNFQDYLEKQAEVNPRRGRTRTEMRIDQVADRVPDLSYDFDGDGVVGQRDYFVGRFFDTEKKGSLTSEQRATAEKELQNGFLDKFKFGFDATGSANPEMVVSQKAGRILTCNNMNELSLSYPARYPPHHPAPKHKCGTEMRMDRLAEARNSANDLYSEYLKSHPPRVKEKMDLQSPCKRLDAVGDEKSGPRHTSLPAITSIRGRAFAEHQAARVRAGLLPIGTQINPEREDKIPGLGYTEHPQCATRSEIKEARRRAKREDAEAQRRYGEEFCLTPRVRKSMYEAACHQFRKGPDGSGTESKTRSLLKANRKRDRMEYDRKHFGEYERTLAGRYSDQGEAWWTLGRGEKHKPGLNVVPHPDLKITETVQPDFVSYVPGGEGANCGTGRGQFGFVGGAVDYEREPVGGRGPSAMSDALQRSKSATVLDSAAARKNHLPSGVPDQVRIRVDSSLPPLYRKLYEGVPSAAQRRLFDAITDVSNAERQSSPKHRQWTGEDQLLDATSSIQSVRDRSARDKHVRRQNLRSQARGGGGGKVVSEFSEDHPRNLSLTGAHNRSLTATTASSGAETQKLSIYHRRKDSGATGSSASQQNANSSSASRPRSMRGSNRGTGSTQSLNNTMVNSTAVQSRKESLQQSALVGVSGVTSKDSVGGPPLRDNHVYSANNQLTNSLRMLSPSRQSNQVSLLSSTISSKQGNSASSEMHQRLAPNIAAGGHRVVKVKPNKDLEVVRKPAAPPAMMGYPGLHSPGKVGAAVRAGGFVFPDSLVTGHDRRTHPW